MLQRRYGLSYKHRQLAKWLIELKQLKAQKGE
jgi:hypothetical protein